MKKFVLSVVFATMTATVLAASSAGEAEVATRPATGLRSAAKPCTDIVPYTGDIVLSSLKAGATVIDAGYSASLLLLLSRSYILDRHSSVPEAPRPGKYMTSFLVGAPGAATHHSAESALVVDALD